MHTDTHLHTYPRGWEASLPGKVSLIIGFSSPSGSYYPRLALQKGEGIPFQGCCPSLCTGSNKQICPPSSLSTGGGIEIYRFCYIGHALMEKISSKQPHGRNFSRSQLLSTGSATLKNEKLKKNSGREIQHWTCNWKIKGFSKRKMGF